MIQIPIWFGNIRQQFSEERRERGKTLWLEYQQLESICCDSTCIVLRSDRHDDDTYLVIVIVSKLHAK